jgi:PBSX family phage terminase large subunit
MANDLDLPEIYFKDAVVVKDGKVMFNPEYTYILFRGGRGRAGSWTMIAVAVVMALQEPMEVLVLRQTQSKIKESVWKLIYNTAKRLGVEDSFRQTKTHIEVSNGSRFTYDYMHGNETGIRSKEGIRLTLGEECQDWEKSSINALTPTITRDEDSQFIGCFNPQFDTDPIETEIMADEDCLTVNATIYDNYFAPKKLLREAEKCKVNDYDRFEHDWMGGYDLMSEEVILSGKFRGATFDTPEGVAFYHGGDWSNGGQDPHAFTRSFVIDNTLYIDWDFETNDDLDQLEPHFDTCPSDLKAYKAYCDEANPQATKYWKRRGYMLRSATKNWAGVKSSVRAGINYLKAFDEIVIHETKAANTLAQAPKWKWKKDQKTKEIIPEEAKKDNHLFASLRYAHYKNIKRGV